MFLTLKAKQLTENLPAPTAKLSHASPNSPMKTHLQMTSLLKPTLTRPSPPNLRLPEQSSPKRAEKDTAEAVRATADAEKNAAEAARATADAAKDAVEAARAVANAEVLRLNKLTGGATAGASASGAPTCCEWCSNSLCTSDRSDDLRFHGPADDAHPGQQTTHRTVLVRAGSRYPSGQHQNSTTCITCGDDGHIAITVQLQGPYLQCQLQPGH